MLIDPPLKKQYSSMSTAELEEMWQKRNDLDEEQEEAVRSLLRDRYCFNHRAAPPRPRACPECGGVEGACTCGTSAARR